MKLLGYCRTCILLLMVSALVCLLLQTQSYGADPEQRLSIGLKYTVRVQHYSLEQGLPNRGVLDIEQDQQGFIWIGTFDNAYRFDGYQFVGLPKDKITSSSRLAPVVNTIQTDDKGSLWFFKLQSASHRWLEVLMPGEQQPVPFEAKFHKPLPFSLKGMSLITRSPSLNRATFPLVIPTQQGEVWYYKGDGRFEKIYKPSQPSELFNLFEKPDGISILIQRDQVNTYKLVELLPTGQIRRQLRLPARMMPIWVDPQGNLYLHRYSGVEDFSVLPPRLTANSIDQLLYRLSPDGKLAPIPMGFQRNPFPNEAHYDLSLDRISYDAHHQLFWFLGKTTLFAWHPTQGIVFDLAASGFPVTKLSSLTKLFVDRTGVVWVATQNGFLLLRLQPNRFHNYLSLAEEDTKAPRLSMRGMVQIGDWLWANAIDSWMVNLKTGEKRKVAGHRPENRLWLTNLNTAVRGHDGYFWAATERLIRANPTSLAVEQFPLQGTNFCWAMWQDGRHNFWLGYDQGLSIFNWQQKKNTPFTRYNRYTELAENRVNGFFPDKQVGGIWLASSSGLYLLDTLRGITARYSSRDAAPQQLPFDHITFIHPDPDHPGLYWLATRGGGLIRWERTTGRFKQFTQQDGLSDNTLYAIYEDKKGRLWLPSNFGLISFQKKTGKIQTFLPKDGVAHEEFNLTSHFRAADGRLFLGGLNGITTFMPDEIGEAAPKLMPLVVTQYQRIDPKTGDMVDHLAEFQRSRQIVMDPTDRTFLLTFSVLNYNFIKESSLWYRIVGWQQKWTVQNHPELRVNGLPAGTYELQVRAQNANGQWVTNALTIPITVLRPIYQQEWFLLLCGFGLISATVFVFRWRNRHLKQEKLQLEQEVARRTAQIEKDKAIIENQAADLKQSATLKSRFFANVTHEFRTPLTLLLGPLTYLTKRVTDPDSHRLLMSMERNAENLLELVNDLLDLSKLDVEQMRLMQQPAELQTLIARTVASFESQAQFIGINLTFTGLRQPMWLLLDVQKVETVLKNLLSNALRFTPAGGKITVDVNDISGFVRIIVCDTGSGIHQNDLPHIFERYYQSQQPDAPLRGGTGIGLALARDYCRLWGGKLMVDSQLGIGSTFSFTYPKRPVNPPLDGQIQVIKPLTLPNPAQPKPAIQHSKQAPETILIVEDNVDMIAYLETLLQPYYTPSIRQNGKEALQWLISQTPTSLPSLIISDVMMPEMDGITLLTEIRTSQVLRHIPIIMLTARTNADTRLQALRLGVADYLTKPFDEDELLTRISNLLERARERTAWRQQVPEETELTLSSDEVWLVHIEQLIVENLTNTSFQVNSIAEATHISERQLYRRIKEVTGLSPNQFIQEVRLQTAHEWLESRQYATVKEVCHAVGFQQVPYFSRLFQQRFGTTPGALLK